MRVHVRRWEGQLVSCGGGLEIIGDIWDKIYVKMGNRVCFWKENMSLTWQDIWKTYIEWNRYGRNFKDKV